MSNSMLVFDSHVHVCDGEASLREYETDVATSKIKLIGFAGMWFGASNMSLQGDPTKVRASNDAHIALAEKHPEMIPIAMVHPSDGQAALGEISRLAARGIKVLKLHPHTLRCGAIDPYVPMLVNQAGALGLIVVLDNANILPGDSERLFELAVNSPKTKFIFAHIGGMNFRFWNMLALGRIAGGLFGDNIYFDISSTVVLVADSPIELEFVWTMRNVGTEHVLLGSDYPQLTLGRAVAALSRLDLTAEEKGRILSGNACKLFGK